MLTKKLLIDNLLALRVYFFRSFIFFVLSALFNFFVAENFIDYFTFPLLSLIKESNAELIYTNIVEPFAIRMHLAIIGAIVCSLPFTFWQLYLFVSPGLYKKEKNLITPYLIISPLLFICGALFVYYFIFPNAWKFFLKFAFTNDNNSGIKMMIVISDYLDLCISMMMLFGLAFQLPVIINFLLHFELLSVEALKKSRKVVIVIIFVVSAVLTPPDILSQILLAVPLLLLYESSIFLRKFIKKN